MEKFFGIILFFIFVFAAWVSFQVMKSFGWGGEGHWYYPNPSNGVSVFKWWAGDTGLPY